MKLHSDHFGKKGALGALFCAAMAAFAGCRTPSEPRARVGWGIDACITTHASIAQHSAYLRELDQSSVVVLRERQPNPAIAEERADGRAVVAFATIPVKPGRVGDQLPEDLLAVYRAGAQLARDNPEVNAWEMVGEPDVGYCTDLPDRVAAYQKALYLGIKFGSAGFKAENAETLYRANGEIGQTETLKPAASEIAHQQSPVRSAERDRDSAESKSTDSAPEIISASQRFSVSAFARDPLVVMGALALPPGPWLRRAAANGLLDYTDAYNFHFYGLARDLAGVIAAHAVVAGWESQNAEKLKTVPSDERHQPTLKSGAAAGISPPVESISAFQRVSVSAFSSARALPLWITECGLNAVRADDFLNPKRRQLQADFTIATARTALADPRVALFMPFIFVHKDDPYAMVLGPDQPLPAWTAYAAFTRSHPWPNRPVANPPQDPNPIIVQWLPDNATCEPYKQGGSYRFRGAAPITGEIRIYNFSDHPIAGRVEYSRLRDVSVALAASSGSVDPSNGGSGAVQPIDRSIDPQITTGGNGDNGDLKPSRLTTDGHGWTRIRAPIRNPQSAIRNATTHETPAFAEPTAGQHGTHENDLKQPDSISGSQDWLMSPSARYSVSALADVACGSVQRVSVSPIAVPPMGVVTLSVTFAPRSPHYFYDEFNAAFVDATGRRSPVLFALETPPSDADFVEQPLKFTGGTEGNGGEQTNPRAPTEHTDHTEGESQKPDTQDPTSISACQRFSVSAFSAPLHPMYDAVYAPTTVTSRAGPWIGVNGVFVETLKSGKTEKLKSMPAASGTPAADSIGKLSHSLGTASQRFSVSAFESGLRLWVTDPIRDPLKPKVAAARIAGLPAQGFIKLTLDRPMGNGFAVCIELVDKHGQRFAMWDNFGLSYYHPTAREVWLNLADFTPYFWGRCSADPVFHPADIEEIQLHCFISKANEARTVSLSLMLPRDETLKN